MKIAIRVDASNQIGTGHFMRCLTLADALKQRSAQTRFISRNLPDFLSGMLNTRGHEFVKLEGTDGKPDELSHSHWLGTSQQMDAQDTIKALSDKTWDWLVVDHYALDIRWESQLRRVAKKIFVIDDIADRMHDCDLLLDQNFYSDMENRYENLVPAQCIKLFGPEYALLRPEFRKARENLRKRDGRVNRIFLFFGGSDPTNETAKALKAIRLLGRPDIAVDVVVGAANPHQNAIAAICDSMPNTRLHRQVDNMAELMAASDLAVGAGGSTTWERCYLGLPTILFVLADNQKRAAEDLADMGAIVNLGASANVSAEHLSKAIGRLISHQNITIKLSHLALKIVSTPSESITDHFFERIPC